MDTDNLATVMGPTIVGYSSSDPTAIISEAQQQKEVMKLLIPLSADYWSTFLAVEQENIFGLMVTPSSHLNTPRYTNGRLHTGSTPDYPIFNPPVISTTQNGGFGRTPASVGPVARRTRSSKLGPKLHRELSRKNTLFQSPMLY